MNNFFTIKQLECDHDYPTIPKMEYWSHDNPKNNEITWVCSNCDINLSGDWGIMYYNEKFKYQERKNNE